MPQNPDAVEGAEEVGGRSASAFSVEAALKALKVFASRGLLAGTELDPGTAEWMVQFGVDWVQFTGNFGSIAYPQPFPTAVKVALVNGQNFSCFVYGSSLSVLSVKGASPGTDIVKWIAIGY